MFQNADSKFNANFQPQGGSLNAVQAQGNVHDRPSPTNYTIVSNNLLNNPRGSMDGSLVDTATNSSNSNGELHAESDLAGGVHGSMVSESRALSKTGMVFPDPILH